MFSAKQNKFSYLSTDANLSKWYLSFLIFPGGLSFMTPVLSQCYNYLYWIRYHIWVKLLNLYIFSIFIIVSSSSSYKCIIVIWSCNINYQLPIFFLTMMESALLYSRYWSACPGKIPAAFISIVFHYLIT